jgi:hypothetical protein
MAVPYTRPFLVAAGLIFAAVMAYRFAQPAPSRTGVAVLDEAAKSAAPEPGGVRVRDRPALAKFAARKHVALTIALTPEQAARGELAPLVEKLTRFYSEQGRVVAPLARVEPGSVVESLQPLKSPHTYPRWKTIASDLILFGTPADNVLLMDQARGQIFPLDLALSRPHSAEVVYTRSPFVGEYDVVNILAADLDGMNAAVEAITAPGAPQ